MNARVRLGLCGVALAVAAGGLSLQACLMAGLEVPCETPEMAITTDLTFLMGGDPSCLENGVALCANSFGKDGDRTVPEHLVELAPYVMDQTEVSNLQYRECVDRGVCKPPMDCVPFAPFVGALSKLAAWGGCRYELREFDDLPVVAVSWDNARAYCQWRGKDLPTEAQWERAAVGPRPNATAARKFAWGDETNLTDRAGVVAEDRCDGSLRDRPWPVRDSARVDGHSAEGIYDLTGNVREWTLDDFDPSFFCQDTAPNGPVRPDRPNDCGGTMRQDCVRNATNAPLAPATVNNPVRTGTSPRKVVRGGALCSTNASQVQHDCDLHTRSRVGVHKNFETPDVPTAPPGANRLAGVLNDAQLTGFRCARATSTPPADRQLCPTLEIRRRTYVPPP